MFSSTSAAFAVNYSARAICPRRASTSSSQWLVGTCSPRERNELTVLTYNEEDNGLDSLAFYYHSDEMWVLESSPDPKLGELVLSSGRTPGTGTTSLKLWRMKGLDNIAARAAQQQEDGGPKDGGDEEEGYGDGLALEADFDSGSTKFSAFVSALRWKLDEPSQVASKDPHFLRLWQLDAGSTSAVSDVGKVELALSDTDGESSAAFSGDWTGGGLSWACGGADTVAVTVQSHVQIVDTRSLTNTTVIREAHTGGVTDVDFSPTREHVIVTSGNDRFAKVWDLRNSKAPVERLLAGHTHWVTRAQYNPVHDQLIATGGSDSAVNMWRVASCSSSPWLGDGGGSSGSSGDGADGTDGETTTGNKEGRGGDEPPDMSVKNVDLHEDSVYGLAWSAASPWMCCSLSYDGRVVLSHVPSAEKYKILL